MDQNFNNGFNNQNTDSNGWNNQSSQQDYTQQYNQSSQQDYTQQYNQSYQPNYSQTNGQFYDQSYPAPQYDTSYVQSESKGNALGVASLVMSIISLLTFCFCCVSLPLSVTGLILGIVSKVKKKENNGIALAGIIVSIVALVAMIGFWIFAFISGDASYDYYADFL